MSKSSPLSRMKLLRLEEGLRLWNIHERTGVEESRLSRIERGHRSVSLDEAEAIAEAFNSPREELFEEQADGRFIAVPAVELSAATA